jgi:glycosyltransferase involved in cell wall biosynthesis
MPRSPKLVLLEPDSGGRVSGGYLYNSKLFAAGSHFEKYVYAPDTGLGHIALQFDQQTLVAIDSLFLSDPELRPLRRLRDEKGVKLGCLLHAFPSFIARAQDPRSSTTEEWLPSEPERACLADLDFVIAPGPYVPRLLRQLGSSIATFTCLPGHPLTTGARLEARCLADCGSPFRVATLAAVTRNKGHLDALAALTSLSEVAWSWQVIGNREIDAEFTPELERAISISASGANVEFLGALPHEQSLSALAACDLLLFPSYSENQPLAVMEAMAFGLPVVGYAVGGMCDLVGDTGAGLLVPAFDVAGLAGALRLMITQHADYGTASKAALTAAASWLGWSERAANLRRELWSYFGFSQQGEERG